MSRAISIWYELGGSSIDIDTGNSDLLGTQRSSKNFWSIEVLRSLGIIRLTALGEKDPIVFSDWNEIRLLEEEINLLEENNAKIDYDEATKNRWVSNLRICFDLLIKETPANAIPKFMIG